MKLPTFNELVVDFDFQMHTTQTDGESAPEEMIESAINKGLKSIAITEHVRKDTEWFLGFKDKIKELKDKYPIKIFLGIEAKALDYEGSIDATPETIENAEIVLGVVHRYPKADGSLYSLDEIKLLNSKTAVEIEFKTALGLLQNQQIHVLGHPFGVYNKFHGSIPLDLMEKLIVEAKNNNIAIEINTKYKLDDGFLVLLKKHNPLVSVGSDAHHASEIARSFDELRGKL